MKATDWFLLIIMFTLFCICSDIGKIADSRECDKTNSYDVLMKLIEKNDF